jgi:hypothetical protein
MDQDRTRTTRALGAMIALWVVIVGASAGVILTARFDDRGRGAYDQMNYHLRVIERFAGELPTPDLTDYLSATTPGYHLVLSAPSAAGVGTRGLRLLGMLFAVGLVGVVAWFVGVRARSGVEAAAVVLPLAASMYVMHSAMWLLPDDAAWLGVACVMAVSFRRKLDWVFFVGGGVALAWLVMARQIHVWAAAPIWAAAWLGTGDEENETIGDLLRGVPERVKRGAMGLGATIPAIAIAKLFATEAARTICMEAMQIHGSYGLTAEFPTGRFAADSLLETIGTGTSEIQRLIISRLLAR